MTTETPTRPTDALGELEALREEKRLPGAPDVDEHVDRGLCLAAAIYAHSSRVD